MTRRINEVAETDAGDVDAIAAAVVERLTVKPLHELSDQDFRACASEAWSGVFAEADKRVTFPRGTVSLSDFIGTGDDAA